MRKKIAKTTLIIIEIHYRNTGQQLLYRIRFYWKNKKLLINFIPLGKKHCMMNNKLKIK
jgi:hypothetical protein